MPPSKGNHLAELHVDVHRRRSRCRKRMNALALVNPTLYGDSALNVCEILYDFDPTLSLYKVFDWHLVQSALNPSVASIGDIVTYYPR